MLLPSLLILLGGAVSTAVAAPSLLAGQELPKPVAEVLAHLPPVSSLISSLGLQPHSQARPDQASIVLAGFDYYRVAQRGAELSNHSWEWGAATETLLEVYNPELSVFGRPSTSFPGNSVPTVQPGEVVSLAFAKQHILLNNVTLQDGEGAAGDPASLGVAAIMIGQTDKAYKEAAQRQAHHLLFEVPRFSNGAISQREDIPELWADAMYMFPPFLAYQAVATGNADGIADVVDQIGLYRDVLAYGGNITYAGLFQHIVGPQSQTLGLWSTGNGWTALGMTRVLATLYHSQPAKLSQKLQDAAANLSGYLQLIFDGLLATRSELDGGLVRNYIIGGVDGPGLPSNVTWFGEASGTAGLAAAIYRFAVLDLTNDAGHRVEKDTLTQYLDWADRARETIVLNCINSTTYIVAPTVNPYDWFSPVPFTSGSPEGNSFVGMMGAAYVDCIKAGVCKIEH